jgi:hypothetical protein
MAAQQTVRPFSFRSKCRLKSRLSFDETKALALLRKNGAPEEPPGRWVLGELDKIT